MTRRDTPPPPPLTSAQRVAALRHLAAGYNLDVVAAILHTSAEEVTNGLHKAADELVGRADRAAAPKAHPHAADIARVSRALAAAPADLDTSGTPARPAAPNPADRLRAARALASESAQDPSYRIRQAAAKLNDALTRLESTRRREADAARKRRARKAQLAEKQASSRLTKRPGAFPCRRDGCGDVRDTAQGRTLHEIRAHGRAYTQDQETTP